MDKTSLSWGLKGMQQADGDKFIETLANWKPFQKSAQLARIPTETPYLASKTRFIQYRSNLEIFKWRSIGFIRYFCLNRLRDQCLNSDKHATKMLNHPWMKAQNLFRFHLRVILICSLTMLEKSCGMESHIPKKSLLHHSVKHKNSCCSFFASYLTSAFDI